MVLFEDFLRKSGNVETKHPDISGASIWGVADSICRECQGTNFLCIEDTVNPDFETIKFICITGLHTRSIRDFSLEEQKIVRQRAIFALDELGELGINVTPLLASHAVELNVVLTQNLEVSETTNVPLPEGYKTVGWIKLSEAQLIAATFQTKVNQLGHDKSGQEILATIWHPDGDPLVVKYHSNDWRKRKR
jgi:hypothetical protein